ncbi:Fc.00g020000.m01.CDS01 [Cosmosporella sp. VM-42]
MTVSRGYGTARNSGHVRNSGLVDEEMPLLRKHRSRTGWRGRMMAEVSHSWADVILLLCYLVTGLLDSASIQVWGTFVSMQTGNTVYVGLGLASLATTTPSARLLKSSVSIVAFCVGSFFFGRFHHRFSQKRRWVLCVSFAVQTLFTSVAAIIVSAYPPDYGSDSLEWNVLLPIALIAFQSCGQAVASRALRHDALISVVLTSIYCDLFADRELFALDNVQRNRRVVAPILLIFGAVVGGLFAHDSIGIAGALWAAALLKLFMVITWFFWPAEEEDF